MNVAQDPNVVAYRMERLRNGPRNWIFWIALFTALNGIFLSTGTDLMILAGLVLPFAAGGWLAHLIAAVVFSGLAWFAKAQRVLLGVAIAVYVLDTGLAAFSRLWSGVVMHAIVLLFMYFAVAGAKQLAKQQAAGQAAGKAEGKGLVDDTVP